jgi:hypothetical protein
MELRNRSLLVLFLLASAARAADHRVRLRSRSAARFSLTSRHNRCWDSSAWRRKAISPRPQKFREFTAEISTSTGSSRGPLSFFPFIIPVRCGLLSYETIPSLQIPGQRSFSNFLVSAEAGWHWDISARKIEFAGTVARTFCGLVCVQRHRAVAAIHQVSAVRRATPSPRGWP